MIRSILLTGFFAISFIINGYSQGCGTKVPEEFFSVTKKMTATADTSFDIPHDLLPHANISISLYTIYGDLDITIYNDLIDSLNAAFEPIGISFTICSMVQIKEEEFFDIWNKEKEEKLTDLYFTPNTINLYLHRFLMVDYENVCGYTYLPNTSDKDFIFISLQCPLAQTLIHEMGHFFGLLHPHDTRGGEELVDGSNCHEAGDLICDTEASPNLSGLVNGACEYTGNYKDANGVYYLPTVSNHMSYSRQECRCKFTPGQYRCMVQFYWSHQKRLH